MNLKEVTLTNFRSYKGVHTFRPQLGTFFILGSNTDEGYASNGGGKTSLLASISWGLYGELSTGSSKDSVIYYGEDEVSIEVKFEGLIVRRSKRRNKSEVLEFFAEDLGGWVREDLNQTQAKLEAYLGVSKDLFYNAFWLDNGSKAVQFLFRKPAERLQILQDLLGEGFFSLAKKEATQRRLEAEKQLALAKVEISATESQQEQAKSRIFDLEVDCSKYEKLLDEARKTKSVAAKSLEDGIQCKKMDLDLLESEYTQKILSRTIKLEDLVKNCILLEEQVSRIESELSRVNKGYTVKTCPTCEQRLPEEVLQESKKKRSLLLKENIRLTNLLTEERKKKESAQKEERQADKLRVSIAEKKMEIRMLERELSSIRQDNETLAEDAIRKTKERLKREKENLESLKQRKEALTLTRDSLSVIIPNLKFWEEGFGSRGIQNLLLDDVRGLLDQFTSHYLSYFSGDIIKVVYPKSDKGFEIFMSYRKKDTSVSNLSRGEVGRSNMAVLLALRKMLLFLKKSKIDFLVLDDAISDLDESGSQNVIEMASALSKEIGHVFVTVPQHLPTIKPTQIVRVEKKEGVSCIRI